MLQQGKRSVAVGGEELGSLLLAAKKNPGNECADICANQGVNRDPPLMARDPTTLQVLYPSGEAINLLGWTPGVTKHVNRGCMHRLEAEYENHQTIATVSLLRSNRARHLLGKVLTDHTIDEGAVRHMLQARGFATPVQAVLHRNTKGRISARCPFCGADNETFGHNQMECKQFKDTRSKAHNMVAAALFTATKQALLPGEDGDPGWNLEVEQSIEKIFPDTAGSPIGHFQPDAILIDHNRRRITVLEFTRGMTEDDYKWALRVDQKIAAYHGVMLYLLRTQKGYAIEQQTFVMGILTSVDENSWRTQLTDIGIPDNKADAVIQAAMTEAVNALHMSLCARSAAKEALGPSDTPHPSHHPRPPDPARAPR